MGVKNILTVAHQNVKLPIKIIVAIMMLLFHHVQLMQIVTILQIVNQRFSLGAVSRVMLKQATLVLILVIIEQR